MERTPVCRICSGQLETTVRGTATPPTPADFSPSSHEPGAHGELSACRECGTVQQLALPSGRDLHSLYRTMSDDAYLREERGRRATANRLLDLIDLGAGGRLLDVG